MPLPPNSWKTMSKGLQPVQKKKQEMIVADSDYTKNKGPIACDRNGVPSVVAELGYYLGQEEGMELLRKGIRTLMVQFACGDRGAAKLLFGTAPSINQVDVSGLVGHIVGNAHRGALSPAELRRIEKEANNVIDVQTIEVRE